MSFHLLYVFETPWLCRGWIASSVGTKTPPFMLESGWFPDRHIHVEYCLQIDPTRPQVIHLR